MSIDKEKPQCYHFNLLDLIRQMLLSAEVMELADMSVSKTDGGNLMRVQLPPSAFRQIERKIMAKILLADDEESILFFFSKMLKSEGFEVVTAQDGEEAKEKILSEDPDVIVLDIKMPKCDGFGVLGWVRKNTKEWIPVIMLTAIQDFETVKKGYSLEADHYLTKPCTKKDLVKSVKTMLSLKNIREEYRQK